MPQHPTFHCSASYDIELFPKCISLNSWHTRPVHWIKCGGWTSFTRVCVVYRHNVSYSIFQRVSARRIIRTQYRSICYTSRTLHMIWLNAASAHNIHALELDTKIITNRRTAAQFRGTQKSELPAAESPCSLFRDQFGSDEHWFKTCFPRVSSACAR